MNITSPDLSVLYEFQWLIGLFRYSISPLKQRHPPRHSSWTKMRTEGESIEYVSFRCWVPHSCGLLRPTCVWPHSFSPLFFNRMLWARLSFMPSESSPCCELSTFATRIYQGSHFLSFCYEISRLLHPLHLDTPRHPMGMVGLWDTAHLLCWDTGENWGTHPALSSHSPSSPETGPCSQEDKPALFTLLWYHQKFKFLLQS